jgi:hypothetical protein
MSILAPDWTVFEDGIRRGPSERHGTGTFATRDLPAGTLILVEAGLSAPAGYGRLLMHAVLCPRLLLSLSPAFGPFDESLSDLDLVTEYAAAANETVNANVFIIDNGEREFGGRTFFALSALKKATTPEQRAACRRAVVETTSVQKYNFMSYKASMFNGASTLDELNAVYAFTAGDPACIFFVTRKAVAAGEELLVHYGFGSNLLFDQPVSQSNDEKLADMMLAYRAYGAARGLVVVSERVAGEVAGVHARAVQLPQSNDEVLLALDFSDADLALISNAYKAERAARGQQLA